MDPKTHIGNLIMETLKEKDLSIAWLARQIGYDESNFNKKLKNNTISKELIFRVSRALQVDFFIYYSEELHTLW